MTWDLTTAKTRLNITGATQDVEIQAALDAALSLIESYCDRRFMHTPAQVETFVHEGGPSVSLIRYPLDADPVFTGGATNYKFHADWENGVVHFDGGLAEHSLKVTYSGGYVTLPADLEFALWIVFDGVWASMSNAGAVSVGGVDKISLVGVGSISYDTSNGGGGSVGGPITDYARDVLDTYRRTWA
jgi:hypothetical protein